MRAAAGLLAILCLGGCALFGGGSAPREVPPNPELERSRGLLEQAAAHPTVESHFKDELERARAALDEAMQIWTDERGRLDEDDREWMEIRHLNHIARQRTAIAVMKARSLDAQAALAEMPMRPSDSVRHRAVTSAVSLTSPTQLPPPLQALRPRLESRGLVLTLDERYFQPGQGTLIGGEGFLSALLQFLVAHPAKNLACEGYSAPREDAAQGQRLSQLRARVVQQALLERGLEFSRVTAVGYGSAPGHGGARVELVISDSPMPSYDAP